MKGSFLAVCLAMFACRPVAAPPAEARVPEVDLAARDGAWYGLDGAPAAVDPERCIYRQLCCGDSSPPEVVATAPLDLPEGHALVGRAFHVFVDVVVGEEGQIERFRLLRGPAAALDLRAAVGRCLARWRLTPARLDGADVAVHMTFTVTPEAGE